MSEHRNVALVKRGFQAFKEGDLKTLAELFAPDVIWHSPGQSPLSGDYRGLPAIAGYLQRFSAAKVEMEIHDVLASDTHAVALIIDHIEVDGAQVETRGGLVFNIRQDRVEEV